MSAPRLLRLGSSDSGRMNRGLALALSDTGSARTNSGRRSSNRASEPYAQGYGLRAGESIDMEKIAGRTIYTIQNADGEIVGVRKISTPMEDRPGQYDATRNEATVYGELSKFPGWGDYIIPYRGHFMNSQSVIIDFDWVDGSDLAHRLTVNPQNTLQYLDRVARGLRWLAMHGYCHGDINPGNFYTTDDGRVLMLDFGRTNRHMTRPAIMRERRAFLDLIRAYVPSALIRFLSEYPMGQPLESFFLVASRVLRRAARGPRVTRRARGRRTTSKRGLNTVHSYRRNGLLQ